MEGEGERLSLQGSEALGRAHRGDPGGVVCAADRDVGRDESGSDGTSGIRHAHYGRLDGQEEGGVPASPFGDGVHLSVAEGRGPAARGARCGADRGGTLRGDEGLRVDAADAPDLRHLVVQGGSMGGRGGVTEGRALEDDDGNVRGRSRTGEDLESGRGEEIRALHSGGGTAHSAESVLRRAANRSNTFEGAFVPRDTDAVHEGAEASDGGAGVHDPQFQKRRGEGNVGQEGAVGGDTFVDGPPDNGWLSAVRDWGGCGYSRVLAVGSRGTYHLSLSPQRSVSCRLPLKKVVAGTIELGVLRDLAPRFQPLLDIAQNILDGRHPCWTTTDKCNAVYEPPPPRLRVTPRDHCRPEVSQTWPTTPPSSPINEQHLQDLLRWNVIRPLRRREPAMLSVCFLTPKSCGTRSRALYDARPQNSLINFCSLPKHARFRLAPPLHQVLVGTGHGLVGDVVGVEVDFTSYFFQFKWCESLGAYHGFRLRGRRYGFRVPVQGSALMPFIAQTATLALAEGPSPMDDPRAYVERRLVVTYDNVLIVDNVENTLRRLAVLRERCEKVGVVIGEVKGPSRMLTSCGFLYDIAGKCWTVKPTWSAKALGLLREYADNPSEELRQRVAGCVVWAHRALLFPLHDVAPLLHPGCRAPRALKIATDMLTDPPWRRLRRATSLELDVGATLIIVDGSIIGTGAVFRGKAMIEFEALASGVELASRSMEEDSGPLLCAGDNMGALYTVLTGVPSSAEGADMIRRVSRALRGPLWLTYISTAENVADAASRSAVPAVSNVEVPDALRSRLMAEAVLCEWSCAGPSLYVFFSLTKTPLSAPISDSHRRTARFGCMRILVC